MKTKKFYLLLITAALTTNLLTGCSTSTNHNLSNSNTPSNSSETETLDYGNENDMVVFRPVDCGVQSQDIYEYPFMGLTFKLSQTILDNLDSRDIFLSQKEEFADAETIQYAMLRFSAPTQEQKEQEGISVDYLSWEENLEKIGTIGVYQKNQISMLDNLTGCDTHKKIGESSNGAYEYYLSTSSKGNQTFINELEKTETTLTEMKALDLNYNASAFSIGRTDNVLSVGTFTTQDVFGNSYTQDIFKEYDLTLVNAFATWCSPCIEEIPELEQLRQTFEKKGIKFNVIGVVMDAKTQLGTDEGAIEKAQLLSKRSNAKFPFLVPDDGNMNDRLKGLEAFPESFFVDKNGTIVSDPYMGARSLEEWTKIVEQEFEHLQGEH